MNESVRPLVFGEVLFDVFPDGKSVLGGAPFNVAAHLVGFGCDPIFVSAIGDDEHGEQILQACEALQVPVDFVQRSSQPTGQVAITLNDGQPSYDILADQAYDDIDGDALQRALGDTELSLIYHGSLALRGDTNRQVISTLKARAMAPTFIDVNLREPWWDKANILSMLGGADVLKINDEEFIALSGASSADQIPACASDFMASHALRQLIVTLGSEGVFYMTACDQATVSAAPVSYLVDTVGAGDALASVCILGRLRGWPLHVSLQRAVEFASSICEQQGATIADRDAYSRWLERWSATTDE